MAQQCVVEVRKCGTDEVVKSMGPMPERKAEVAERGIQRNLNHDDYYTVIRDVEPGE